MNIETQKDPIHLTLIAAISGTFTLSLMDDPSMRITSTPELDLTLSDDVFKYKQQLFYFIGTV